MHPGHLVTRWLAVQTFFAEAMPAAVARLGAHLERVVGDGVTDPGADSGVLDEPATARAMATVVARGWACGAFTHDAVAGLAPEVTPARVAALTAGRRPV